MLHLSPHSPPAGPLQRGFTLVELMVTVSILGIVAMMVAPALQTMISTRAVSSGAEDLSSAMRLARSEAMKRRLPVSVCAVSDPDSASADCLTTGAWGSGWVVFVDRNSDGTVDVEDLILKAYSPASGIASITADADDENPIATFLANGLLSGDPLAFQMLPQMAESNSGYTPAIRSVCMVKSGRILVRKGDDEC